MKSPLLPVLLCGGSGTRLWPLSRNSCPKQFISLDGEHSLLQKTVMRLDGVTERLPQVDSALFVCNEKHRFLLASQLAQIGIDRPHIILEPDARNTAPAFTLAALHAISEGMDPVLLLMPADHAMADLSAFHEAIVHAYAAASLEGVVTFGVIPDRPESGYGYIKCERSDGGGVFEVKRFIEKPCIKTAQEYVESGDYFWNSGLFVLKASTWLKAIEICRPDILRACRNAMSGMRRDIDFIRPDIEEFISCPSDSIDYAVMEKLPENPSWNIPVRVIPLKVGWSDIGTWDAISDSLSKDASGNVLKGEVEQFDCKNSLFFSSSGRLVAGIGLEDLVIVETADAVLVINRKCAQDVKKMVAHLAEKGNALVHAHRKMHRPWGWYERLDDGKRFLVKRIVVNPGASLSLQVHRHRAEHWVVVKGRAEVTHGDRNFIMQEDESTYIPIGHVHRLRNLEDTALEIIEIQTGELLSEEDILRIDDVYGRAGSAD
ncbi:mannose-1-phosphate guanylyltransferase/mannose-6-phosphate isomerase [Delftia lacustris]|uniref:mannose-1-phosphate guanylyltransferase/mannose-6-phosphate isomerase n=1 Tax=Delftia lacustris TaxID=558537 RepID=UPI0035A5AF68